MDKLIEDVIFMEHFNPLREPQLTPYKGCPFCGSKLHSIMNDKHVCFRCGKVWEEKSGDKK